MAMQRTKNRPTREVDTQKLQEELTAFKREYMAHSHGDNVPPQQGTVYRATSLEYKQYQTYHIIACKEGMNGSTLVFYKHRQFATIKDAIDEAVRQGESSISMFIRNGTYIIDAALLISTSNIVIRGEDITQTVLQLKDGADTALIQVGNGTDAVSNITIENLELDGNKANQTSGSHVSVISVKRSVTNLTIRHCNIHNGEKSGINVFDTAATTTNLKIISCLIHNNGKDADSLDGAGIELTYATGTVIFDNYIYDNGSVAAINGKDSCVNTYIYDNLIDSNDNRGISFSSGSTIIMGNIITNNDSDGIFGTANSIIVGNRLENNSISSGSTYKSEIFAFGYSVIANNYIKISNASRSDYGIYVYEYWDSITGNVLVASVANCDYGIYCAATSGQNEVIGNITKGFTDGIYNHASATGNDLAHNMEV